MLMVKLTNPGGRTPYDGEPIWEGKVHQAWAAPLSQEKPRLCSGEVVHAYKDPLQAYLYDRDHCSVLSHGELWVVDGEIAVEDSTKVGCRSFKVIRRLANNLRNAWDLRLLLINSMRRIEEKPPIETIDELYRVRDRLTDDGPHDEGTRRVVQTNEYHCADQLRIHYYMRRYQDPEFRDTVVRPWWDHVLAGTHTTEEAIQKMVANFKERPCPNAQYYMWQVGRAKMR